MRVLNIDIRRHMKQDFLRSASARPSLHPAHKSQCLASAQQCFPSARQHKNTWNCADNHAFGVTRPGLACIQFCVLLRLSYRSQLASGSQASFVVPEARLQRDASGVVIVRGGEGSSYWKHAFGVTARRDVQYDTGGMNVVGQGFRKCRLNHCPAGACKACCREGASNPSISMAPRMSTIWRSPPGIRSSFLRMCLMATGNSHSLNGAFALGLEPMATTRLTA